MPFNPDSATLIDEPQKKGFDASSAALVDSPKFDPSSALLVDEQKQEYPYPENFIPAHTSQRQKQILAGDKTTFTGGDANTGVPVISAKEYAEESPEVRELHQKNPTSLLGKMILGDSYDDRVISSNTPFEDLAGVATGTKNPMVNPDDPIIKLPKPSQEFINKNPVIGTAISDISQLASGLTTPENIKTLGALTISPDFVQKLVGIGFTADQAYETSKNATEAVLTDDPQERKQKIGHVIAGIASTGLLAWGIGHEGASKVTDDGLSAINTAPDKILKDAISDEGLPAHWKVAVQAEIKSRLENKLNATADGIESTMPLTAKALRQTQVKPPGIPVLKEGENQNENQPTSKGAEPDSTGSKPSVASEQPASETAIHSTEARQPKPDQGQSGNAEQVLNNEPPKEVIQNEKETNDEKEAQGRKDADEKKDEVTKTEGSTPSLKPAIYQDGEIRTGEGTHAEILNQATKEGADFTDAKKGFVDDKGKFINRTDAAKVALDSGQIDKATYDNAMSRDSTKETGLHSEDLKPVEPSKAIKATDNNPVTSIKNAVVDQERASRGLPPRIEPIARKFGKVWEDSNAAFEKNPQVGTELVESLKKTSRPLSDTEDAILTREQVTRQNDYENAADAVNKSKTDAERAEANVKLAQARDAVFDVYDVGSKAGTANARGLNARKMMVKEDYSLSRMEAQKRAANDGKPLSDEQLAEVKGLHEKIQALEKKISDHESSKQDAQVSNYFDQLLKETAKQSKEAAKKGGKFSDFVESQADQARARIRARGGRLMAGLNPAELVDHVIIGASYIAKGISGLKDWSVQMVKEFGENVKPYLSDLFERSKQYHEANAKLFKEDTPADQKATVEQVLAKAKTEKELNPQTVYNLARAHVNAGVEGVDSVMKAVHADLAPLHEGLTERDVRDAFSGYGKVKFPSREEDLTKLREYRRLGQLTSAIEDANKGEPPKKTGLQRDKPTQTVRDKMDELKAAMEANGIETKSPEDQLASKNQARENSLRNQIEGLDKRLKTGEKPPKGTPVPDSGEVERLRSERDAMKAQLDEIENPPRSENQKRLDTYKKAITKRIADLQEKVNKGDYSKTEKKSTVLDAEALKLQANRERLRLQFDRGLVADKLSKRTPTEKFIDAVPKWSRAFKLSSPITFAKLAAASVARMAFTPLEEAIGGVLSKVIPSVAERAPSEGGFNAKAIGKAYSQAFTQGMKDAYDTLRTGESDLSSVYGRRVVIPKELTDLLAHMHGAMKAPTKRFAMTLSMEKRFAFAAKNGVDISDPLVQTSILHDAYTDANRAIFMQDSAMSDGVKAFIARQERANKTTGETPIGGRVLAAGLKTLFPVIKIPFNMVGETVQYATGLFSGSARLANAFRKGVEKLSPDKADLIMREFKKGTVGSGLILAGFLGADVIGGYYQQGKKQKEGDIPYGHIRINGVDIPNTLLHNPALELLQVGATIKKVAESKLRQKDQDPQGIPAGVWAAGLGLLSETPLVNEQLELSRLFNPYERASFMGEFTKNTIIPQGLQWVAKATDPATKRDPQSVLDYIKTGIPGLRETVPEKEGKKFSIKKRR